MTATITSDWRGLILNLPPAAIRAIRARPGDRVTLRARKDGSAVVRFYRRARVGGSWLRLLGGGKTRPVRRPY